MKKTMSGVEGTVRVTERIHLLAWRDALLDRRVVVSIVLPESVRTLEELAERVDLGDLLEAVRKANEKLPELDAGPAASEAAGQAAAVDVPDRREDPFELPPRIRNLRFVVPDEFLSVATRAASDPSALAALHGWLTGGPGQAPLGGLGLLGRALAEERVSEDREPWTLATLLVAFRAVADAAYKAADSPARLRETLYTFRTACAVWAARVASESVAAETLRRLLDNPLSPFALRRASPPPQVGELADQVLDRGNPWELSRELVKELDERFGGALTRITDAPTATDGFRNRTHAARSVFLERKAFDEAENRDRIRSLQRAGVALAGIPLALAALKLLLPGAGPSVPLGARVASPEFLELVQVGAVAGAALGAAIIAAAFARHLWRLATSPVCRHERALRAELRRLPVVRASVGSANWAEGAPAILKRFADFKEHCLDYHALTRLELPPLDRVSMYEKFELRDKWGQNAAACFSEEYTSLVIGASQRAAVYFVDVVGSTEISTKTTLSNALEVYSRMLRHANETGLAPMWRKEIGDGRIYCHPANEALKRAMLTVQGAAHPRIGLSAGIGLSVGEIYRDVTTGDFLNEVTNRASRLNARVEAVGAWAKARWPVHPHRVFVKWGLLYNAGIALDDRALAALGADGLTARPPALPFEWRFPAPGEPGANVHWLVERIGTDEVAQLAKAAGFPPVHHGGRETGHPALTFEAFCSRSSRRLTYATTLDGDSPAEFLGRRAVEDILFLGAEIERDLPVIRHPVTLPNGATIHLALKPEQAVLKGVGATVVAEAEVPPLLIADPEIRLAEFLAGTGAAG